MTYYCQLCKLNYTDKKQHVIDDFHIKKEKKERKKLLLKCLEGEISLEDINKILKKKILCKKIQKKSNGTNFSLNCEPTQFTKGKTEKTLSLIAQRYLLNSNDDSSHIIEIIITNKSLLETKQWNIRLKKKFKGDSKIKFDILSSEKKANFKNIDTYISKLMQVRNIEEAPNILIMCCHEKRVNSDCISLLNACEGREIKLGSIRKKIKFNFCLDEPDANLGVISKFIKLVKEIQEYKNMINNILFITATPYDDFWKMLAKHKIHSLSNIDYEKQNSEQYESYVEKYRQLKDHTYRILNNLTDNPLEFIKDAFLKGLIEPSGKKIIFAPAHLYTKKEDVGSHEEVKKYFLEKGYWVYLNNSQFKGFIKPDGNQINEKEFNEINNVDGELRDTFRKWNELNPDQNLAITGYWTVERGVTMNTDGFNMTHMIVSSYHMNKNNKLVQLMGRACGGKKYVKKISIICTREIQEKVISLVENLIRLRMCNPEDYNKTDFDTKNKKSTIPIKMTILDREVLSKFQEIIKDKNNVEIHKFIKNSVKTGYIKMEDKNNMHKFSFKKYTKIQTTRKYVKKENDKKENRRFKQMNTAFEVLHLMSQKTEGNKYALDIALDEYSHEGYTNPTNIFWITYQKM